MSKKVKDSVTVAFRLTPEEHGLLVAQAENRRQTAGTYARQVVLDTLYRQNSNGLGEEFQKSLREIKEKMGLFATVLLSNKLPLPASAVNEWVKATWLDDGADRNDEVGPG